MRSQVHYKKLALSGRKITYIEYSVLVIRNTMYYAWKSSLFSSSQIEGIPLMHVFVLQKHSKYCIQTSWSRRMSWMSFLSFHFLTQLTKHWCGIWCGAPTSIQAFNHFCNECTSTNVSCWSWNENNWVTPAINK